MFKENSTYNPRGDWNAYDLNKNPLYLKVIEKFSPVISYDFTVNWINITEYNKGDGLRHHRDESSTLTIICEITDSYKGGSVILDRTTTIDLNKGDVLLFDGSKVTHGVEKVIEGQRLSLNLWTVPNTRKTLI